jgi:predicted O-methyltransferase YrrM
VTTPADMHQLPGTREVAQTYVPVEPAVRAAMDWAVEVGIRPVPAGAGAVLRLLAATAGAKAVAEIGTGTGASGLWLLRGMQDDGILTTIDIEPEHQRLARQAYRQAGLAPGRTRVITGRALEVLPRLADGGYDLVFVDGDVADLPACTSQAHRILRLGGLLVLNRALGLDGRVADPTARDPQTAITREVIKYVRDAPEWLPTLLDAGDGLLCAIKIE